MRSCFRAGPKRRVRISEYTARKESAASKERTYVSMSCSAVIFFNSHFCGSAPAASAVCHWKTASPHRVPLPGDGRKRKARVSATASASASPDPQDSSNRAATTSPAGLTPICTIEAVNIFALGQARNGGATPKRRSLRPPSSRKTDCAGTFSGPRNAGGGSSRCDGCSKRSNGIGHNSDAGAGKRVPSRAVSRFNQLGG